MSLSSQRLCGPRLAFAARTRRRNLIKNSQTRDLTLAQVTLLCIGVDTHSNARYSGKSPCVKNYPAKVPSGDFPHFPNSSLTFGPKKRIMSAAKKKLLPPLPNASPSAPSHCLDATSLRSKANCACVNRTTSMATVIFASA